MRKTRPVIEAKLAPLAAALLLLSACASTSSPAPIVYAGRTPAVKPGPLAGGTIDFTTPPFDEYTTPRIAYDQPTSECVPFARANSGVKIWGDAVTWWEQAEGRYPRSSRPTEGSVLVLRGYLDNTRGHVSVVKALLSPRVIRVDHANWLGGGEVTLDVPVIDVSPANDWTQVRVWHVPGMHWGGRTYEAHGFIQPIPLNAIG